MIGEDGPGQHLHPAVVGHGPELPPEILLIHRIKQPFPINCPANAVIHRFRLLRLDFDPSCSHAHSLARKSARLRLFSTRPYRSNSIGPTFNPSLSVPSSLSVLVAKRDRDRGLAFLSMSIRGSQKLQKKSRDHYDPGPNVYIVRGLDNLVYQAASIRRCRLLRNATKPSVAAPRMAA
jgi:hypothetical protein